MKCPNCVDTLLVMADKQGVEIDYCPNCRGVWLDRGNWTSYSKSPKPLTPAMLQFEKRLCLHLGHHILKHITKTTLVISAIAGSLG